MENVAQTNIQQLGEILIMGLQSALEKEKNDGVRDLLEEVLQKLEKNLDIRIDPVIIPPGAHLSSQWTITMGNVHMVCQFTDNQQVNILVDVKGPITVEATGVNLHPPNSIEKLGDKLRDSLERIGYLHGKW